MCERAHVIIISIILYAYVSIKCSQWAQIFIAYPALFLRYFSCCYLFVVATSLVSTTDWNQPTNQQTTQPTPNVSVSITHDRKSYANTTKHNVAYKVKDQ